MRVIRNILSGLLLLLVGQTYLVGQNRVDSLRQILDSRKVPDSAYIRSAVELCKMVVNTDNEFLIPEYAMLGLKRDTATKDIRSKCALLDFLGNYYWQVGKLTESGDLFNQMRIIGETPQKRNPEIIARSYIGLGTVFYQSQIYDRALDFYQKGLALSGSDSLLIIRFYHNIANTFMLMDKMDSVFVYYNKSVVFNQYHKNYRALSIVYGNIALAYQKLRSGPEVRKYADLAFDAANNSGDPYQIASILWLKGDLSKGMHPVIAEFCFKAALSLAKKYKSYDHILTNLESLAALADSSGKYKLEITYLHEFNELRDSLDLENSKSRLEEMELEHNTILSTHEDEVKLVRREGRQKELLILLSVAFISLLALLLMRMQTYRLKIRINRSKEQFLAMIAHDIRNPFSGILGISGLLREDPVLNSDPVHHKQISTLDQSLNNVYELLENLLQWSQAETGKIAFNPVYQPLAPFVHESVCLLSTSAKQKQIHIENQVQGDLLARFDSNMLQTVIRNLLSNAIKFSKRESTIFVSAEVQGESVIVKVRDEGVGMNTEQLERLFKPGNGTSTKGTLNEPGTGLGLLICRDFIIRHGGTISAVSNPGSGTTMIFTLPDVDRKANWFSRSR